MSQDRWPWLWLFPITLAVHVVEERLGGAKFYDWLDRPADASLTAAEFAGLTLFAIAGMTAAVAAIQRWPALRWLAAALSVAIIANGLSHAVSTLAAATYNPGVVSGILLWWPLGGFTLARCHSVLPASLFWRSAAAGLIIQVAVSLTTIIFTVVV